jgi:hypothetical protein
MEKGFVYVARLIDYNNKFVGNYFKIGKTQQQQYKIRETQLNSTQLPIDVIFVRVFETQHMSGLEKIFHACFDEYRVTKTYGWRRNIVTEWFEMDDDELLINKIDKIVKNFPNTTEVDIVSRVQSDTGTTINQKTSVINNLVEGRKKYKLTVMVDGEDISEDLASETMVNAYSYIANKIGFDNLDKEELYLSINRDELFTQYVEGTQTANGCIKEFDGYHLFTGISNKRKCETINSMIKRYNITEMTCDVVQVN